MRKIKNISIILGLLLSFVTIAADNSTTKEYGALVMVGKTYTARIISSKAVVYKDENMLLPLGYIGMGKAIVVGNPRRMNRDLVPMIVKGQLAYIEIKDIRYEDTEEEEYNARRGPPKEHNFDILLQKPGEKYSENNSLYFNLHTYSSGYEVKKAFLYIVDEEKSNFVGFQLQFIHRDPKESYFWGTGLDYSGISSPNMKFSYLMLSPTVGYTPYKDSNYFIDLYGSFDLAINTQFQITDNLVEEPTGFVFGPQVNSRIVFFPNDKYHVLAGLGIRKYFVQNLKLLKDLNDQDIDGISGITGISLFIGFGMEFK